MEFPVIQRITGILRRKTNDLEVYCGKSCLVVWLVGETGEVNENLYDQSNWNGFLGN